jgi:hypothetical protein
MAASGNQFTRIGAALSGVAVKLTIAAKAEQVAPPSIAWLSFVLQQRAVRLWLS